MCFCIENSTEGGEWRLCLCVVCKYLFTISMSYNKDEIRLMINRHSRAVVVYGKLVRGRLGNFYVVAFLWQMSF